MTLLSSIEHGRTSKPPRILLYGIEGIGKSTFGSQAPNPVFLATEDGLDAIDCSRFPLAETYGQAIKALTELRTEPHSFETVVVDSVDWLERLVWDKVCQVTASETIEKADGGYARGYAHALIYWREIISHLNALRNERGMVILLVAHAKVERFEDPETSAYDRYSPRLNKHAAAFLCEWVDAIFFATRRIRTQTEDAGFNRRRTIAQAIGKDGGERILRTTGGPSCIAKNRYGIAGDLPLAWAALMAALTESHIKGDSSNG